MTDSPGGPRAAGVGLFGVPPLESPLAAARTDVAESLPCVVCATPVAVPRGLLQMLADPGRVRAAVRCPLHRLEVEDDSDIAAIDLGQERAQWRVKVPFEYQDAIVRADDQETLEAAQSRIKALEAGKVPEGLLLGGATGIGKTSLAYGILNSLVASGAVNWRRIVHGSEEQLLTPIANAWPSDRPDMWDALITPQTEVVFIDELASTNGYPQGTQAATLMTLFERLARRKVFLIVTTQYIDAELLERALDARVYSRLVAYCGRASYEPGVTNHRTGERYATSVSVRTAGSRGPGPVPVAGAAELPRFPS